MTQVRFAILLTVPLLAGCAGEQVGLSAAPAPQTAPTGMTGRWFLAAPNAPPCGMSFGGGDGAQSGSILPEGGCPGRFFLSRRWTLQGQTLTISDQDSNPLGELTLAGERYEGKAVTGMSVTLSRTGA